MVVSANVDWVKAANRKNALGTTFIKLNLNMINSYTKGSGLAVDDGLLLASANEISGSLKAELFHHIPGLAVANVQFAQVLTEGQKDHFPQPFRVDGKFASGLLEIVNTPKGERMRLRVSRHVEGLKAAVAIARGSSEVETMALAPVSGDHHILQSAVAPQEPHEFSATLVLKAGKQIEKLVFAMAEPEGHHH